MRPNLSHPSCKNELDELVAKEKSRLSETCKVNCSNYLK